MISNGQLRAQRIAESKEGNVGLTASRARPASSFSRDLDREEVLRQTDTPLLDRREARRTRYLASTRVKEFGR